MDLNKDLVPLRTWAQTQPQHQSQHAGIPTAEDLRTISANASLWHTLWWWLDQAASRYNKLWTPS